MVTNVIFRTPAKVESVDFHPTNPWILASLESGTVSIWNYDSKSLVKSLKVSDSRVRTAKFIESQSWIVCGSDDGFIHVYLYNTWEKVKEFKAHEDFIMYLAVHAKSPLVLSASGDKLIKLWNSENDWVCKMVFPGHSQTVTYIAFLPIDINTFASASLDCTVKVWNIGSPDPKPKPSWNFPDSKGINCVTWFSGDGDKQYLIIGCNDCTAQVLDYETGEIVKILKGHKEKVTAACKHPKLPYLITASADGTVILWEPSTYDPFLPPLDYNLGKVCGIACKKDYNGAAFGCDKGVIVDHNVMPELSASAK